MQITPLFLPFFFSFFPFVFCVFPPSFRFDHKESFKNSSTNDDGGDGGGSDRNDDGVAVKNGNPSGGGGDCGETVAVYKHAAVKTLLIKQD